LKIYDPSRITLRTPSLTLHMIIDQTDDIFDFKYTSGGQGANEIGNFLNGAGSRLPQGNPGILYCDHLAAHHKTLAQMDNFCWDVRLVPVSISDANIIENSFSSLKAKLYRKLHGQQKIFKIEDLQKWCEVETNAWWNGFTGDMKAFNHSYQVLKKLVKAGGDLQQAQQGIKSLEELKIQLLPCETRME